MRLLNCYIILKHDLKMLLMQNFPQDGRGPAVSRGGTKTKYLSRLKTGTMTSVSYHIGNLLEKVNIKVLPANICSDIRYIYLS